MIRSQIRVLLIITSFILSCSSASNALYADNTKINDKKITYEDTKTRAWVEKWIHELLKGKRVPGLDQVFAEDDRLLEKYYGAYGRGKRLHDPRTLRISGKYKKASTGLKKLFPGSALIRRFQKIFKRVVDPLFDLHFPELRGSPKLKALYDKIERETYRNVILVDWTAHLHQSKVPDMANLWFGISHPIYDAMFDTEIDEGENAPKYSIGERLVRATCIIMRDYKISEPLLKMEKILIAIVKGLEESIPSQNVELFFNELFKLNVAQIESIRQKFPNMTNEELRLTTFRKGAYSMRLYATLADHDFNQYELEMFYLEGAFLQSLDDMSDVYEDQKEGGKTLVVSKLIVPEELWSMRDLWFQMVDDLVIMGVYDQDAAKIYFDAIDTFLIVATDKYMEAMEHQRKDGTFKEIEEKKSVLGLVLRPFAKLFAYAFPMLRFAD